MVKPCPMVPSSSRIEPLPSAPGHRAIPSCFSFHSGTATVSNCLVAFNDTLLSLGGLGGQGGGRTLCLRWAINTRIANERLERI